MSVIKIGSEFLVNTQTGNSQQRQAVATLSDGKFLVSWIDASGVGGDPNTGIKAQLFEADGTKSGGEFLVNTTTFSTQFGPTIAALSDGSFVISWRDDSGLGDDTSSGAIKAQIYNASGVAQGTEFLVNTTTAGNQHEPTITGLADGGFVATWRDESGTGGDASGSGIKAQIFAADGTKEGPEFLVNTETAGSQVSAKVIGLFDGGFVVTWTDPSMSGGDTSSNAIRAQIFDADGAKSGTEFLVNTETAGSQQTPAIAALLDGNFIIVWQDSSGQGGDASSSSIKARIYASDGGTVSGEFLINTQTLGAQTVPTVTALSDGGFAVSWQDSSGIGGDASGSGIRVQVFDSIGWTNGNELLVNTATVNNQSIPTITALAGGSFVVSWMDGSFSGGDASGFAIKAQIFGPDVVAPTFQSASVNGATLTLTYDEALAANAPPEASDFEVQVNGSTVAVSAVAASGATLTLTLATPVANGQTVTVGYTDPDGDNIEAVQDAAGNDAATIAAQPVTNATPDTTAPVFQSASVNGATLTLTYGEALAAGALPPGSAFDVQVGGSTVAVSSVAASGSTVTLTLATAVANGQTVTVGYTDPTVGDDANAVQDAAGNDSASITAQPVTNATPDTTAPVFTSASVNGATLTLTYDEALAAGALPAGSAFNVQVGGSTVAVISVAASGSTVTLTLATPVANGQTVTVGYTDPTPGNDANAVQDAAGNDAASLAATSVTNATPDTTRPMFQSASINGATLTMAFNEALDTSALAATTAFEVFVGFNRVAISSVAASGSAVTLTLATAVTNNDFISVRYTDPTVGNDPNAVQDIAGNDAFSTSVVSVTNTTPDIAAPSAFFALVDGSTVTVEYSEELDAAALTNASSFQIFVDGNAVAISSFNVDGSTITLTLATPVTSDQSVTFGYTDPNPMANDATGVVQDAAGNDAASIAGQVVYNVTPDTTAPVFTSASVNGSTLTLTYSEALAAGALPAGSAFDVQVGGSTVAVSSVAASGSTLTLTLATAVANGQTVTVGYTDPTSGDDTNAVQDAAGNDAASLTATGVTNTTPDTTAPVFTSATVNGSTLTLTYSEALAAGALPAGSAFEVQVGGSTVAVSSVAASGSTVTLTLATAVANGQTVTVGYSDPTSGDDTNAVQDAAGNDAASITGQPVTNTTPDTTAPVFQSASVNGATLTLTYSEALAAGALPAGSAFEVQVNGSTVAVSAVAASGSTLTLTLATPVANGQTVTVGYTDPSLNDDPNAVQDAAGNDAASLAATSVTNVTPPVIVIGTSGNDILSGGIGTDGIYGGDGADTLYGGAGADYLYGETGNDTLSGEAGVDALFGGIGDDALYGGSEGDHLYGGDGTDALFGEAGDDVLFGEAGNDRLFGGSGSDTLHGGAGMDTLFGEAGADSLYGGAERDILYGQDGADILYGEAGNDRLEGGAGDDLLNGGSGQDALYGEAGNDTLIGGADGDYLYGGGDDDVLYGEAGADALFGQSGNDTLIGGADGDYLYGEAGIDHLYGEAGSDALFGGDGGDILYGQDGIDYLYGENGADQLDGGAGNDALNGGTGNDVLVGGLGSDFFYFDGSFGLDTVTDFSRAEGDRFVFTAAEVNPHGGVGLQYYADANVTVFSVANLGQVYVSGLADFSDILVA